MAALAVTVQIQTMLSLQKQIFTEGQSDMLTPFHFSESSFVTFLSCQVEMDIY